MHTTTSIQRSIARKLVHNVCAFAILLGGFMYAESSEAFVPAERPNNGTPVGLAERHDCHRNVIDPTHVVVTIGSQPPRYYGQAMTDKAIEQEVYGIDHGLRVHMFCK